MTKRVLSVLSLLTLAIFSFGQVKQSQSILLSQEWSKEITEYRVKEYIVSEILQIKEGQPAEVYINALTASFSGELTAVIYDSKSLGKRGLIFCFWNDYFNEFDTRYQGYGFKVLEFEEAKNLLIELIRCSRASKG